MVFSPVIAQSIIKYEVVAVDSVSPDFIKEFFGTSLDAKDSLSYYSLVQQDISALWSEGYLTSSLDTIFIDEAKMIARVFIGEQYTFSDIEVTNVQQGIVSAAGLKNVRWKDKMISQSMIIDYTESLLTYLENNGYPFAKVRLDSTSIENGVLNGKLKLDRRKFVPFDSININGNVEIRQAFLDRYLNIKAKDPYSRKKINNINRRINDLTYLELDSIPIIKFANDYAQVQLFLKPKKASRFDFLIGVLPTTVAGETKFNITGEFTTEMYNRLGQGEYIYANFQRIDPTQQLELRVKYPYLFNLPIGIDIRGGIYFNEEFRETIFDGGILYQFDGNLTFKASWNSKSSRLIEIDTASIIASRMLPNKLDVTYNGGGIEFAASDLDYRFNPSKGWNIRLGGTVGIKKIIRNNAIEALSTETTDFGAAYDSLETKGSLNTFQTEMNLSTALFIPAFKVATLKLGIEGGIQYNEERLYDNELHRIGGNKLLRGFDEQSILTDKYLVSTIEFRLLLDRNSYLSFPFIDYGITHVKDGEEEIWDTAISFGLGINFATTAGIFNVSFAAGKRLGNPLDFGNTKLHFGYVSLF
ncbi:MAG: outer membrane protein assembly factor BamA [Saprospiraceae bacterium]|jgi:outer membrane protein assembly factor BamA